MLLELQLLGAVKPDTIPCNIPTTVAFLILHVQVVSLRLFRRRLEARENRTVFDRICLRCSFHFVVASDFSSLCCVAWLPLIYHQEQWQIKVYRAPLLFVYVIVLVVAVTGRGGPHRISCCCCCCRHVGGASFLATGKVSRDFSRGTFLHRKFRAAFIFVFPGLWVFDCNKSGSLAAMMEFVGSPSWISKLRPKVVLISNLKGAPQVGTGSD